MAGARGGFSNADIKVMMETNAQQVADAFNSLTRQLSKTNAMLKAMTKSMTSSNNVQTKAIKNTRSLTTVTRDWLVIVGQGRSALLNLKMVTLDLFGTITKVSSSFEKLGILMSGLSKETDAAKRMEEVGEKTEYLINMSKNAPYSIDALKDAFIKLDTVGLKPAEGSLQGLVDAVSAFGGDEEAIKRAGVALQQMAGKGVVSMEELRQQLGESVPMALQMMARGARMSMGEFVKLVSQGKVEATSAIQAMNREFIASYAGASEALMETGEGLISKLKTEWLLFIQTIGEDSGLYDSIKDALREMIDILSSPEAKDNAIAIGKALKDLIAILSTLVKIAIKLKKVIIAFAEFFMFKKIFSVAGAGLSWLFGKANGVLKPFKNLLKVGPLITKAFNNASAATKALAKLLATLRAAGGPLTILLSALAVVGLKIYQNFRDAKEATAAMADEIIKLKAAQEAGKEYEPEYSPKKLKQAEKEFDRLTDQIAENNKEIRRLNTLHFGDLLKGNLGISEANKQRIEELQKQNEELKIQLDLVEQIKNAQEKGKAIEDYANSSEFKEVNDLFRQRQEVITSNYKEQMRLADEIKDSDARRSAAQDEALKKEIESYKKLEEEINTRYIDALFAATEAGADVEPIEGAYKGLFDKISDRIKILGADIRVALMPGKGELEAAQEAYTKDYIKYLNELSKQQNAYTADTNTVKNINKSKAALEANKILEENRNKTSQEIADIYIKQGQELVKRLGTIRAQNEAQKQQEKIINRQLNKIQEYSSKYAAEYENVLTLFNNRNTNVDKGFISLAGDLQKQLKGLTGETLKHAQAINEETLANYERKTALQGALDLIEKNKDLEAEIQQTRNKDASLSIKLEIDRLKKTLLNEKLTAEQRKEIEKDIDKHRDLLMEEAYLKNRTSLQKMFDDWDDYTTQFDDMWTNTFEDMADRIAEFVKTGKFEFKDFAQSIIDEINKIVIKWAIAQAAMKMGLAGGQASSGGSSGWGNFFNLAMSGAQLYASGGTSGVIESGGSYSSATVNGRYMGIVAHTGGIIGADALKNRAISPEMFANATKYHTGGVAGLKPDEVPAVLQKGEGVFTKEQMKAMGNKGANVTVNVINNTQQDVTAEQSSPRFDGEKMILDVVLNAMNRPGSFRDGMKGSM